MASLADLQAYAAQVAQQYGIPVSIFDWQINQESGWNPNAQSSTSSANGIAQFTSGTASMFGIDSSDPYQSLQAAAQYDSQLYQQNGGNWTAALTQYGTLAGASAATMASFNNVLSGLGLSSGSTGSSAGTQTAGQVAESDSFVTKIAMIILGIVLIGGAIVVYGRSKT